MKIGIIYENENIKNACINLCAELCNHDVHSTLGISHFFYSNQINENLINEIIKKDCDFVLVACEQYRRYNIVEVLLQNRLPSIYHY